MTVELSNEMIEHILSELKYARNEKEELAQKVSMGMSSRYVDLSDEAINLLKSVA